MPSSSYKRRLRSSPNCNRNTAYIAKPIYRPIILTNFEGDTELIRIQNYFYKVIDMIIENNTLADAILTLNNIITEVKSRVELYKIIDIIESQLLSLVVNISDETPLGIIQGRIDYIKTIIDTLPPDCEEYGPVSIMILEVITSIQSSVSFDTVIKNILDIQKYITDTYGNMDTITLIQDNLLGIIENIAEGDGASTGIINTRLDYVKTLISTL